MIGVTDSAKQELKRILTANSENEQASLRLIADEQGQLGLNIDAAKAGDQVVEHDGTKVLIVEQSLADQLQGIVLDAQDSEEGTKLVIAQQET